MIVGLDVGCAGITHDGDGLYLHGEGNYHQGHSVIQAGSNALTCRQISAAINEVVREASGLPLCLTASPTEPQEFVQAADVTSWDESNTVCSTHGLGLCSRAQLCPGYDPATMIDTVAGTMFNGIGAADGEPGHWANHGHNAVRSCTRSTSTLASVPCPPHAALRVAADAPCGVALLDARGFPAC